MDRESLEYFASLPDDAEVDTISLLSALTVIFKELELQSKRRSGEIQEINDYLAEIRSRIDALESAERHRAEGGGYET